MKDTSIHYQTARALFLALVLLFSPSVLRAQYVVDLSSIDYFATSGAISVPPMGGQVGVDFSYSGSGPQASVLRSLILEAIDAADCRDIVTDVSVEYTYGTYEGTLTFTVAANVDEYREVEISASTGSVTLTQAVQASAVYTLTRVNPSSGAIWHGQTINLRLSSSDTIATYQLCRTDGTTMTCGTPIPGTGGILSFTETRSGTYTALSDYPSLVEMNGSITVDYLAFYAATHTFSPASHILNPNGGSLTVPFVPAASANIAQLNTILSAYSGGLSSEWNNTVHLSYGSNALTLTWGPNLGAAIRNRTYFVNGAGDTLTFVVPSGGALLQQDYTIASGMITLAASQPLVSYSLLAPDETTVSTQIGTGGALSFTVPQSPAGTWRIRASYKGASLLMRAGIAVTATGEVLDGGENWILSRKLLDNIGTGVMRDITYYDGLGYPVQTIQADASHSGGSIVTLVYYDNVRRADARTYLPFVAAAGLAKTADPFPAQASWQASQHGSADGTAAYAVHLYEPSSLNRVTATRRPGSTYASGNHDASFAYEANTAGKVLNVHEGATSAVLAVNSYYPAGALHCTTVTDEDGVTVRTFIDNLGRTVLERRLLSSTQAADTYYVYDGAGRVTWVVTPEGSALLFGNTSWTRDDTNAAAWCYRYTYDGLGRLTERRQPGRQAEYFVYDPAGRLVARQDGNLRAAEKWILSKYNAFGEEVRQYLSGSNVFTFAGLTAAFALHAEPPGVYTHPSNVLLLERAYDTRPSGAPAFTEAADVVSNGEITAIDKGRLTYEKLADLSTLSSSTVQYVRRAYYYDGRGRLRSETATLGTQMAAVKYGYDVLGRPSCDTLTDTGAAGIVTDTYDIRGQLVSRTAKKGSTTLFSETLRYANPTRGTAARYGGGLSEVMTLQGTTRNTYGFTYDDAGRVKTTTRFTGTSGTSGTPAYTERGLTYNRSGALMTLQRYDAGTAVPQDNYAYTYSGPLLTGVSGKDGWTVFSASFAHDGNGNTTTDGRAGLTYTYNILNRPETVKTGTTIAATYHWLADGTKYRVADASGNGVIYAGALTYAVSGNGTTYALESADGSTDGTARFLKNGASMAAYYTIRDHLGSVRTVTDRWGSVAERNDYYPFGQRTTFGSGYPLLAANRRKFSGKEDQSALGTVALPYLDFGARMYDPKLVRWNTYDPLAEKTYGINPYVYCANDPVSRIDPDGREIRGITKQDAKNFRDDIYRVLADDKFANIRTLIDIKGKTFRSIDAGKLSTAMEGLTLTDDESAYITMVTSAINSRGIYKVEYVSGEYTSPEGARAFVNHMNKELGDGMGDRMVTPDGKLSSAWIRNSGDGLNVPTHNGSHSFIGSSLQGSERAVISGHEVFGHGIPVAKKLTPAENNANAIRTDNLIRRILGLPQRDGSNHGGYKEGHITNPYILPILK